MKSISRSKSQNLSFASVIAGTIVAARSLFGQPLWANSSTPMVSAHASKNVQALDLVLGKSTVVNVPVAIKRASLANPAIADAMVLSPKQIYVTGKGFGATNLTLWGKETIRSWPSSSWRWSSMWLDSRRSLADCCRMRPTFTLSCSNDHLTL